MVGTPFFRIGWRELEPDLLVPIVLALIPLLSGLGTYPSTEFVSMKTSQMLSISAMPYPGQPAILDAGRHAFAIVEQSLSGTLALVLVMLLVRFGLQAVGLALGTYRRKPEEKIYRALGARHLLLCSSSDEAVAALIAASHIDESEIAVFPRMARPGGNFLGKVVSPLLLLPFACGIVPGWFALENLD